jgi:hypothetical protein
MSWPALGPRLSGAVRALSLLVTRRPCRESLLTGGPLTAESGLCSRGLTVPQPSAIASDDPRSMSLTNK